VCLGVLFRDCAPSTPLPEEKLKLAFDLFLDQLSQLSQPSHPEKSRHIFLLETMVVAKTANVLATVTNGENILHGLFELAFALAKVSRCKLIRGQRAFTQHSTRALRTMSHSLLSHLVCVLFRVTA
jgi:hypothetical protein